jgi:hypothetical protein
MAITRSKRAVPRASKTTPHARLAIAFVLAVTGVGCASTTTMPLPMLAAGYSPAHASANHAATPGHGKADFPPSARYSSAR